jgi:hypothetical protein
MSWHKNHAIAHYGAQGKAVMFFMLSSAGMPGWHELVNRTPGSLGSFGIFMTL